MISESERAPRSPLAMALALAPATLLAGVAGGIAFPILPIAGVRLGLSLPFIGVILAANRATRIVSSPLVGLASDRVGGRRVLLGGLVLSVVVMALYALGIRTGHAGAFFLGGRLLHGPASACVFVSAQALALHGSQPGKGGRSAGIVRSAAKIGVPLGLALGGILSDRVGPERTFEFAGLAVVLSFGAAFILVPDLRAPVSRPAKLRDVARTMAGDRRLFACGALNMAVTFAVGGVILTTLSLLVHERRVVLFGRTELLTAGLLMGWMTLFEAFAMPLAGRIGDRHHAHAHLAGAGLVVMTPGLVLVGLSHGFALLAAGLALVGLGAAGLGPSLIALIGVLVPRERQGAGVGLLQVCGDVGGTLGPIAGTALFGVSASLPYLVTGAMLACFVPLAVWLARAVR